MKLLKVDAEGYHLQARKRGAGLHPPFTKSMVVSHEAIVAILTGLADLETLPPVVADTVSGLALQDAANFARRQIAGVAWTIGVCSWNMNWQPIKHDANPFHKSD